jgi:hypothetical protein
MKRGILFHSIIKLQGLPIWICGFSRRGDVSPYAIRCMWKSNSKWHMYEDCANAEGRNKGHYKAIYLVS